MNSVDKMLKYIISKWYVVLVCALLCSGALYVEKSNVAPSVALSGDQLYTRMVRVEPLPIAALGNDVTEIDLGLMLGSKRAINSYIENTGAQLDYEKLCSGWHNLSLSEKFNWVGRHIAVRHVGIGLYEMEIQFVATDARDAAYVEENSKLMMDIFEQTIESVTSAQTGGSKLITVDEQNFVDMQESVTQNGLRKKYAIIGFVLGCFAGMAVLAVLSLRKKD